MTAAAFDGKAGEFARASLDRLDAIASAMERRWGVDRLPKLVDAALAVRFAAQRDRLDEAIRANHAELVSVQAEAMIRAWNALDAEATKAGAPPLAPTVWETVLPRSGEVIAIVRDSEEEAFAPANERKGAVWTLAEVAVAIEAFGEQVRAVKATFPGAEVTSVRPAAQSAALNIGSAAAETVADPRNESVRPRKTRTPKSRSAGFAGLYGPLPDRPAAPSAKPPPDWDRGDDIPF
jgi:hypothetical protein